MVATNGIASKTLVTSEIIPEIFGTYQGEADPLFIEYFDTTLTKPVFINDAKFHKLSRFSKYSIKKNDWISYYYDNEEASKVKKETELSVNKIKELTNP